ncbi:MAG: ABC transporter permease [Dehalococcoidales bacterium]|nr:ABC transporter permease [Dehalococcoidales bacterium]
MSAYVIRRLLLAVFVLFAVSALIFFAMRLLPGDPLILYFAQSNVLADLTPERLAALHHEYGLDRPIIVQYFTWLGGVFHGDFGNSLFYHLEVTELLKIRYPVTLYLGLISVVISAVLGILAGLLAAIRRGKWLDNVITPSTYVGITIPIFWLGILMIYVFGIKLNWLPIIYSSPPDSFWMGVKQIIMPIICLSVPAIAGVARQMRSSMLEVIRQDYIRTAWSKGLKERGIIVKHALKNSLIPVVTVLGLEFSIIIGGSVIVETVFSIPGIGYLMVSSIFNQDYAVVQTCTLVFAVMIVFANLLVDISYGWLDPRIKYG